MLKKAAEVIDRRKRHPDDARSTFERWVLIYGGTRKLAETLGLHQVTVNVWLGRRATPSLETAYRIIELAAGELTLKDILDGTKAW